MRFRRLGHFATAIVAPPFASKEQRSTPVRARVALSRLAQSASAVVVLAVLGAAVFCLCRRGVRGAAWSSWVSSGARMRRAADLPGSLGERVSGRGATGRSLGWWAGRSWRYGRGLWSVRGWWIFRSSCGSCGTWSRLPRSWTLGGRGAPAYVAVTVVAVIGELERELGVVLFVGPPRRMEPTSRTGARWEPSRAWPGRRRSAR